jgi:MoxR-like ATPase
MHDEHPLTQSLQIAGRLTSDILAPMKSLYVGKDEVIDLLGVCLVAGEHLFILGPPGTAKSALVQELSRRLEGKVFDYLLTRFTEPNELFGPFDIRRLREGDLVTNTEGMLPEATFVFLDELLNANSAILNSLLMVLNERIFRRGRETRSLPLLMVVGASNRLPEDDTLGALFDRFLARVRSDNVPAERLSEVLTAGWQLQQLRDQQQQTISIDELRLMQHQLTQVDVHQVRPVYLEVIEHLRRAGIAVSDRRAVKLQRLVAASAMLCGRQIATRSDLWVLRYIWDTDEQREVIHAIVQAAVNQATPEEQQSAHPRASGQQTPNPEELAKDLEQLSQQVSQGDLTTVQTATLRERLALLAGRCPWVVEAQARTFLQQRVSEIWKQLGVSA